MVKNILFDMGNVLAAYDSGWVMAKFPAEPEIQKEVLTSVFFSQEWVFLDMGLITEEEGLERMKSRLDTIQKKQLAEQYFSYWHRYNLTPVLGMEKVVRRLKQQGKRVYVLSNASIRLCKTYKDIIPAWECFDGMLFSAEVKYIKPQKEIYLKAFERFQIMPEESFFVDDLQKNIEGGKKLGMDGYVFDGDVEKLEQHFRKIGILD